MDREIKELEKALEQIWDIALRFGLDPYPVHFEIVPATVMYEVGSYALPGRYSHWTFGKAYHRMKMMYDLGLSRIYEVVINTNPSYGFLLETNSLIQNKLVMAHVLGHVDFFKNNAWFSRTNRRMVDEVSVHAARINEYEFTYGRKAVEDFLDAVLSIEEHIDPDFFVRKDRDISPEKRERKKTTGKFDDLFPESAPKPGEAPKKPTAGEPVLPEKDLVWFVANYSPILEPWQRDVMSMIHAEMLYFVPQMQTKILNEGWACATGDSLLATERGFVRFDELYEAGRSIPVASGGQGRANNITDFHKEEQVPTIRVRTRRGLTIEGSENHRLLAADGRWVFLKDLALGDRIHIEAGGQVWPRENWRTLGIVRPQSPARSGRRSIGTLISGASVGCGFLVLQSTCVSDERSAWRLGYSIKKEDSTRTVPVTVLRSPKSVMSAFLRGCFDAVGKIESDAVVLPSASAGFIRTAQIILLNYGILSWQRPQSDGCTQLAVTGKSAERFLDEIGFSLARKQKALREYVESHRWFKREDFCDEIVSVEQGRADVYDITVAERHAYVANGFLNHNSFWHSRIMRELDLDTNEHMEFAELHAGVVSPHKGQLNPYYLGYKILEDIERRWDNPTKEERERFGRKGGEGRQKLFEVREVDNDISFLRNYLTEELCEELDLYVFELVDDEEWTITEKRWERVRDQLVASKTNFGFPYIVATDADHNGNRELYLTHRFEGAELDLKYARKVLEHIFKLWGRTVHLETKADDEKLVLHFDGKEHDED